MYSPIVLDMLAASADMFPFSVNSLSISFYQIVAAIVAKSMCFVWIIGRCVSSSAGDQLPDRNTRLCHCGALLQQTPHPEHHIYNH